MSKHKIMPQQSREAARATNEKKKKEGKIFKMEPARSMKGIVCMRWFPVGNLAKVLGLTHPLL